MGYTTFFSGEIAIEPPLNEDEIEFLRDFNQTRRMHRSGGPLFVKGEGSYGQGHGPDEIHDYNRPDPDQPGLWCQWVPSDDGRTLAWDEGEKFYDSAEWMEYIVNKLLSPAAKSYVKAHLSEDERLKSFTCDHVCNGEIFADGEDSDDNWKLKVTDNVIEVFEASLTYGDEEPEVAPPTNEEVREALKSLGVPEVLKVKVWTLTIDDKWITTQAFGTELECFASLKTNYDDEDKFDIATVEGRSALIEELTERQGVVLYIDEHSVEVPTA